MRRIEYSSAALTDLRNILDYVGDFSPDAAERIHGEIIETIEKLGAVPGIGHRRDDVQNQDFRFHGIGSYVVGFQYDEEVLSIIRVVHGSRDFKRLFK